MSTETAVETKIETAATQSETVVAPTATEVDFEAELAKANDKIAKLGEEKENYRKGMLKAKGKLPDEDDNSSNDEDVDSKVKRLVQEEMLKSKEAQAIAEKDALVMNLARTNKELSLALKNRQGVSSQTGQGSNQEKYCLTTKSTH